MPSVEHPLTGGCACGAVRFEVTAPFRSAGYCHCHRCQRRSGMTSSLGATVDADAFAVVQGASELRSWQPPGGRAKVFCVHCGGHVFSGELGVTETIGVRLGTVDDDPGIRASWHQWVDSAPDWDPLPDDGLTRFPEQRPA